VDGLNNFQVGFPDALPAAGDLVDITSYPICGSQLNIAVQVGKLVELECDTAVSEAAQYQYVIIQSLDTVGEKLCLAEIGVYEPGQYAVAFVLFVIQAASHTHTRTRAHTHTHTVPFYTNNTIYPFLCYKYPYTIRLCLTSHPKQLIFLAYSTK